MRSVRVEMRKWPDSPHWEFDGHELGSDSHGDWIGIRSDTLLSRPGRSFHAAFDHLCLVPQNEWWSASFYGLDDAKRPYDLYVDITTPATRPDDDRVRMVDLDLDVIRGTSGRVFVDDEDEFADHRVRLGYPDNVVASALASVERVLADVRSGVPPFDDQTSARWLAEFRHSLAALS